MLKIARPSDDAQDNESLRINRITGRIIDAAVTVHSALGPGLLESVYEICLAAELAERGMKFERQAVQPIYYKNIRIDSGLRLDFLVDDRVIIELKAVDRLQSVHTAQLLTYLKLSGKKVGLLINFNVPGIKLGIKRIAL